MSSSKILGLMKIVNQPEISRNLLLIKLIDCKTLVIFYSMINDHMSQLDGNWREVCSKNLFTFIVKFLQFKDCIQKARDSIE